ncbi:MAG: hypothetical protein COB65_13170 [Thalassobium sp.]|nr:MAG: hypothetical protein COB65_13170 [Thalassobium sp.]
MAILFALVLIAIPLAMQLRGVGAAGMALSVAAINALMVFCLWLITALPPAIAQTVLRAITLSQTSDNSPYLDTYYVVANIGPVIMPGLLFGGIGLILWVLTRWNALVHQWLAKTLFWVLHLGVLAMPFVALLLSRQGMPRRYTDYTAASAMPNTINMILAGSAALAFLLMVTLMLWSVIARLRR